MKIEKKVTLIDTQDGKPCVELSMHGDGHVKLTMVGFRFRAPTIDLGELAASLEALRHER